MCARKKDIREIAEALSRPEPPQAAEIRPGDPQISALVQYLTTIDGPKRDDVFVDLGSGNGILALVMDHVWPPPAELPRYVAVDLSGPLADLSLPIRVHNNSVKIEFDHFLTSFCASIKDVVRVVVIRNVFHELDIGTTARLITQLNNSLNVGTEIYIQDMISLPRPERGNAGWSKEAFEDFLRSIGFRPVVPQLVSFGGTDWFLTTIKVVEKKLNETTVAVACATHRESQRHALCERLARIKDDYTAEETTGEYVWLSLEIAGIDLQLSALRSSNRGTTPEKITIGEHEIPLRPAEDVQYSLIEESGRDGDRVNPTGIVAGIRNKEDIVIHKVVSDAQRTLWFAGYSQKLAFEVPENRQAFLDAAQRGLDVRFLLVDPNSLAARLRARSPIYSDYEELRKDITRTIESFLSLITYDNDWRGVYSSGRVDMKISSTPPICSYFIVDDLCFMSLYSQWLTGSAAPCLVFTKQPGEGVGYYEIMQAEFNATFQASARVKEVWQ